jgi:hypothetical protein
MTDGHRIQNRRDAFYYIFGGKALFTLVSQKSGQRFTYRVNVGRAGSKWEGCYFIDVLTGSDNTSDYAALGMIKSKGGFIKTSRSRIDTDAPSHRAFRWLVEQALMSDAGFEQCEVWHHGHCSACGRRLTDPDSIARGLGPVCAEKMVPV